MHVVEFSQMLLEKITITPKEERLPVLASELATYFGVQNHEIGLFRVEAGTSSASFVWPLTASRQCIQIPLSLFKGAAISKTAHHIKGSINNQLFETPHLKMLEKSLSDKDQCIPIQKIMTATGFLSGQLRWIVQVAKKGQTPEKSGSDFTSLELKDLEVLSQFIVGMPI